MRRSAALRASAATILAALMLLASGDTQRASATGIPGTIHSVAGGGVGDGGAATNAAINHPTGASLDAAGGLYIADRYNCRVRRVFGGVISTVAGGVCGYSGDGGAATAAALDQPSGVALDAAGAFYISEYSNCRVRRVSGGLITTVAGNGACGFSGDGGPATSAGLFQPSGVALDATGDLYIADASNCRVRRVSAGVITTVAGSAACGFSGDGGSATAAALGVAYDLALDSSGDLYIADTFNCRVRRVSGGIITTVAGNGFCGYSGEDGAATSAQLDFPSGVALDAAGDLFIADTNNCRVRRVSAGVITTVAGMGSCAYSGDGGSAIGAALNRPDGMALSPTGDLFIADQNNCRVRKLTAGVITTAAGTGGCTYGGDGDAATAATLAHPRGVVLDTGGNLYIADSSNCRVRRVSGGVITTVAGTSVCGYSGDGGAATAAALSGPEGLALSAAGDLFIAGDCRVRRVSGGIITLVAGTGSCGYSGDGGAAATASLSTPRGMALDSTGGLYIAETTSCRVRRVSSGIITTVAGTGACGYSGDGGPATSAELFFPQGLALDAAGSLYIADLSNGRVRRVSGGVITTVLGGVSPNALALNAAGDLYMSLNENCRVSRLSDGALTTVAGGSCGFSGDGGAATGAALSIARGIAFDAVGDLYIADTNNDRVRIVHTSPCPFDLNDSGQVSFADLLLLAKAYNSTPSDPNWNPAADFDGSAIVGLGDLLLLAGQYNDPAPNCPP